MSTSININGILDLTISTNGIINASGQCTPGTGSTLTTYSIQDCTTINCTTVQCNTVQCYSNCSYDNNCQHSYDSDCRD